jgi:hypothetical protein
MTNLGEICRIIESSGSGTSLLRQACALPRSDADLLPLPDPHSEAAFDSAWDVLLAEAPEIS